MSVMATSRMLTRQDLDALPDNGLAFVLGVGLYRFDADSTLMPDGERVIAPTGVTGPGRWLLELPGLDMVLSAACRFSI